MDFDFNELDLIIKGLVSLRTNDMDDMSCKDSVKWGMERIKRVDNLINKIYNQEINIQIDDK